MCRPRKEKVPRVCELCGKVKMLPPSHAARGDGRFCSRDCASKAQRKPKPKPQKRPCLWCGKHIGDLYPNKKFCSKDCGKANRERFKPTECPECGESFRRSRGKYPGAGRSFIPYCSKQCAEPYLCIHCNIEFAGYAPKYCFDCHSALFAECHMCEKYVRHEDAVNLCDQFPMPTDYPYHLEPKHGYYPVCKSCFDSSGGVDHRIVPHREGCHDAECKVELPWGLSLRYGGRVLALEAPLCAASRHSFRDLYRSLKEVGINPSHDRGRDASIFFRRIRKLGLCNVIISNKWGLLYDKELLDKSAKECCRCGDITLLEGLDGDEVCDGCRLGRFRCHECWTEFPLSDSEHSFGDEYRSQVKQHFCSVACCNKYVRNNPDSIFSDRYRAGALECSLGRGHGAFGICAVCLKVRPARRLKFCSDECQKASPQLVEPLYDWNPLKVKEALDAVC